MLTKLEIRNYKSICDASITLTPFTLLIGANGTGKSNLMSLLKHLSKKEEKKVIGPGNDDFYSGLSIHLFQKHFGSLDQEQLIRIENSNNRQCIVLGGGFRSNDPSFSQTLFPLPELSDVRIFNIDPHQLGKEEPLVINPTVHENGIGVVQVLDSLKTGDREDLFNVIERTLEEYIPEVQKLSFSPRENTKKLQVRERYIPQPVPVEILSEGTRFVIAILTILYQERPPSLICIEDIDRGLHPRLFQQIIELCRDLSEKLGIQIIATTHNPYILDEFVGNESAVVIVEKNEGCTTFTTLAERLAELEENGSDGEMPLGSLWYSGLVGGVPKR